MYIIICSCFPNLSFNFKKSNCRSYTFGSQPSIYMQNFTLYVSPTLSSPIIKQIGELGTVAMGSQTNADDNIITSKTRMLR